MAEHVAWAVGGVGGGIALLVILQRLHHYKKLHEEWVREMNAQAEGPFENEASQSKSPRAELATRP